MIGNKEQYLFNETEYSFKCIYYLKVGLTASLGSGIPIGKEVRFLKILRSFKVVDLLWFPPTEWVRKYHKPSLSS